MLSLHRITFAFCALLLAVISFSATGCDDDTTGPDPQDSISVPSAYTFQSRFDATKSSVDYGGQIVRNLLIQDIRTVLDNLAKSGATPITADDLLKYYEHNDASNLATLTNTGTLPALENRYASISTGKKLSDKISSANVLGKTSNADALIREWFATIAANSQDPTKLGTKAVYIDSEGRDLRQLIDKVLMGSVSYYQATGVYLNGILDKNNQDAVAGKTYTEMEHNWDEAFGYFGPARNYGDFSDAQLAGGVNDYVKDVNGDGKIDLTSEFNYPFARYAGKRDVSVSKYDFSKKIFDAFLKGRAVIAAKGTSANIQAQRQIISDTWERIIVANIAHYINEVQADMLALGPGSTQADTLALSEHWSELKGFVIALQYNPFKKITDLDLNELNSLVHDKPTFTNSGVEYADARSDLDLAKDALKGAYGIGDADLDAW